MTPSTLIHKRRQPIGRSAPGLSRGSLGSIKSWPIASFLSVLVGLGGWAMASAAGLIDPILMPGPAEVWKTFLVTAEVGYAGSSLLTNVLISLARLGAGFLLAVAIGVPLGLAMGLNRWVKAFLDPILEVYRPLPALAYYTLIVALLGVDDASKVVILFLGALPPIILSTTDAVRHVRKERLQGVMSLGLSRRAVIQHVIFPSCLPEIFSGIRIGFGYAFTTLVAAEMIASTSGLGWLVFQAGQYSQASVVLVGITILGLVGLGIDAALRQIQRLVAPWSGRA